ncbi:MAG: hypothetical protein JF563_01285 [Acidobacteriales bacterium]|nr:hypothetical protein [Terriglobales bacterium]
METRSALETPGSADPGTSREALQRVLVSRTFSTAPRLCSLLQYIVENSLSGKFENLTEQQIGIQIFNRSPGYNSAEDTIVRGTARHLRHRLEQYYADEGHTEHLRITVPKGGYVASFETVTVDTPHRSEPAPVVSLTQPAAIIQPAPGSQPATSWPVTARATVVFLTAVVVVLPLAVYSWSKRGLPVRASHEPQILWQALFTPDRKTLIVPGDASLDAYVAWEQKPVSLENYANQSYQQNVTVSRPPTGTDVPLSVRSVTPMADLRLVSELIRAPEHMGMPQLERNIEIRYARDVAVADTHDNNLILIGSETFNPWVTLYQPTMDFVVHWDYSTDLYSIENKAPKPGEQKLYSYERSQQAKPQNPVTHIALLDNSQGQGRVLIVEGTSMGTTYGAVNLLTHQQLWNPVISAATDSSGRLHNFEALLSGDFVHGGVSNTHIIALHIH